MRADRVLIGIHVHAEPDRLQATLDAVRRNSADVPILLLPDGPDEPTRRVLETLSTLPQSGTEQPLGAAACFNRLASWSRSSVVILLESGSEPGPRWLDHLLAGLDADPRNGLAGPSTNMSWNEQAVFRGAGAATPGDAVADLERRFGSTARTLEPLYSLADFCYGVRREVIDRIGAADEGYGLGPCWEMDYNIRAARAGFRGVWACAAYVFRSPFTPRRRQHESVYFEASRRRYQDKFCGRRLRGSEPPYRAHCGGDSCPNFAPASLIAIYAAPGEHATSPAPRAPDDRHVLTFDPRRPHAGAAAAEADLPLVTCIMPTADRAEFLPQAIRCFLRQDYPRAELVIVDDGERPSSHCVPPDPRIRYLRASPKATVGGKRNAACRAARGELILHWDDDDWYPPSRIRRQVRALLDGGHELCGTSTLMFFDPSADRAWEYRYQPGVHWVAGTSLLYRKAFWERHPFPDVQVGEDAQFVWSGAARALLDLQDPTLCVATVHRRNTSRKDTGGTYWHSRPVSHIHELLGDDVWFYRTPPQDGPPPLVSCIMPTYNRRALVPTALDLFRRQDYPARELIVVDDGEDSVEDLVKDLDGVRYVRLPRRMTIGAKRNAACEQARGEIIAHWDDDDWYAPDRLRYQVGPIAAGQADMTGLDSGPVLDVVTGTFWAADSELHRRMFAGNVHGGTLVYRRHLPGGTLKYPEVNLAEDAALLHMVVRRGHRLRRLANPGVFVYVRHSRNAWREYSPGTFIKAKAWRRVDPPLLFPVDAIPAITAAASGGSERVATGG
jgi:O-antigen biosynthesis protein